MTRDISSSGPETSTVCACRRPRRSAHDVALRPVGRREHPLLRQNQTMSDQTAVLTSGASRYSDQFARRLLIDNDWQFSDDIEVNCRLPDAFPHGRPRRLTLLDSLPSEYKRLFE